MRSKLNEKQKGLSNSNKKETVTNFKKSIKQKIAH